MELVYNEKTKEWKQKSEPFITIECETEEDFEFIGTAVAFYKKHIEKQEKPQTNADRIRAMSDEELVEHLYYGFDIQYCNNDPACAAMLDTEDGVPEERCKACVMRWLKQPAEDDHG